MKRIISILLCLALVLGIFPMTAFAASPFTQINLTVNDVTIPKADHAPTTKGISVEPGSDVKLQSGSYSPCPSASKDGTLLSGNFEAGKTYVLETIQEISAISITGIQDAPGPQQTTGYSTSAEGVTLEYDGWWTFDGSTYNRLEAGASLESGREYYLHLYAKLTDTDKYSFSDSLSGTVNNGTVQQINKTDDATCGIWIKVTMSGSIQGHDLGDCKIDVSEGPTEYDSLNTALAYVLLGLTDKGYIGNETVDGTLFLDLDKNGGICETLTNLITILRHDERLKEICYNELSCSVSVRNTFLYTISSFFNQSLNSFVVYRIIL